jgi:uncharacterized membrane protein YvbJ
MARRKKSRPEAPPVCPVCGEDVPRGSLACPECGADRNSGWREDAESYDGLDLPDENFDYDEFVRREFPSRIKPAGIKTRWWITAIVVIIISVVLYLFGVR